MAVLSTQVKYVTSYLYLDWNLVAYFLLPAMAHSGVATSK